VLYLQLTSGFVQESGVVTTLVRFTEVERREESRVISREITGLWRLHA